jgi:hypothetical protein
MIYDALKDRFSLDQSNLRQAAGNFRYALKNVRKAAGLPLDKYQRDGALTPADHAQKGIIEGAKALGIDLGADWGNEIDLRDNG